MVLTAYFALSPVIGFLVTVARRMNSANLTPASRRQDHTTSPSASTAVRLQRAASTASRANVRDECETPLCGRDGSDIDLIWANREAISFCKSGWTGEISLIRLKKLAAARRPRIGLKDPLAVVSVVPLRRHLRNSTMPAGPMPFFSLSSRQAALFHFASGETARLGAPVRSRRP
jgi:hypothetical protein